MFIFSTFAVQSAKNLRTNEKKRFRHGQTVAFTGVNLFFANGGALQVFCRLAQTRLLNLGSKIGEGFAAS
jgi:hypothetical protein